MAREHGKDKGPLAHPKGSGKWWVRIYVNGRERRRLHKLLIIKKKAIGWGTRARTSIDRSRILYHREIPRATSDD